MNVFNRLQKTPEEIEAETAKYWKDKRDYWRRMEKIKKLFFKKERGREE